VNRRALILGLIALATAIIGGSPARALAGPFYDVHTYWGDSNLPPGGEGQIVVQARNIGDASVEEELLLTDQLPAGVVVKSIRFEVPGGGFDLGGFFCGGSIGTETAKCHLPEFFVPQFAPPPGNRAETFAPVPFGYLPTMYIGVEIDPGVPASATNTATLTGGGTPAPVTDVKQLTFGSTPAQFGLTPGSYEADFFDAAYPFGAPSRQAGDRPSELRVNFDLTRYVGTNSSADAIVNRPHGKIKTVEVTLPRGMIGNPEATPKCDPVDFAEKGATASSTACPADTQVGYLDVTVNEFIGTLSRIPIYNLEPPKGQAADFAFNAAGFVQAHIYPTLDPAQNYAIKTVTPNISNLVDILGSEVTFWGVPGDPSHDKFRAYQERLKTGEKSGPFEEEVELAVGAPWGSAPIRPLLTNPTDCGFDNGGSKIRLDSYQHPGVFTPVQEDGSSHNVSGCDDPRFRFEPDISLDPTSKDAGASTGLTVHLEVPQRNDEVSQAKQLYAKNGNVKAIPIPPLKKAVVTLPQGMTVNPAAAQGLNSCSPAQIGLGTAAPVTCPDASQFGTLTLHTPLLPVDEQPEGFVYVAKQNDNPFHNFLSLYLVIQQPDRGILVKVPGRVDLDPGTGQITTTFDDLPQLPLSDMEMNLKGGLRAGLVNPQTCGTKTVEATFYSWQDPGTPHSVSSSYDITQNPDGTPCHHALSERPFDPSLSGGTLNSLAGSFSPLEIQMSRSDEDQELSAAEGIAPPGLLASLRGVGRCSDTAIAAAVNPNRSGAEEQNSPSCPASSLVGTVDAGAGVGQILTYVQGKVYLAGPYKGAPLSGVAIVPAVAGPFDLGTIVTRAPAYINPKTAEIRLVTDPLPQIFKGVPVRVRDIRVHVNRSHFVLNPTSCEPFELQGTLFSSEGKRKSQDSPFQAAECSNMGFKPRLSTRLFGGTHRGAHPKFRGVFRAREGDANVASAVVTLPRSEFLDQSHIRTVCTRVQFVADACPTGSIYGHAVAKTPLLDEELSGPVYLRSSDHKLPDLVADLHGIIDVEVVGRIDSIKGGIRANFEQIPDAPVESFTISMQGGKKGLLVNSRNICAHSYRLNAEFKGQNGKQATLAPRMAAACKSRQKAKRR
jgi:hypothetical protein